MPRITVSSSLCDRFTGGQKSFEIDAADTRGALRALDAKYPGLEDFIDHFMSVAIDGEICQDFWTRPLAPESEVFLLPRIGGG